MPTKKSRKSYTVSKKLEVVTFAEKHDNREAGRVFEIGESNIREWRRQKLLLDVIPREKRAMRRKSEFWPILESELKQWILNQRIQGFRVSTVSIKLKARCIAESMAILDFQGSNCWCNRFMKRHRLSIRAVTSVGQNLPMNWEEVANFRIYLSQISNGIELQHIGNMDEVPITFDMPSNFTVDRKGIQDVRITTTGSEKCSFTLVLCVTANGGKLIPMVIFKRKTMPKEKFPPGIIVKVNEKGWMNQELMKDWLNEVWVKRKGSFFNPESLLIYDSCPAHLTENVKELTKKHSKLAVIPAGLTKLLQPLDVSVNKSFKNKLRSEWEKWMIDGLHQFTKSGKMKKASYSEICKWIVSCWASVTPECIKNGFRKAQIIQEHQDFDFLTSSEEDSEFNNNKNIPEGFIDYLKEMNFEDNDSDFEGF